MSFEESLDRLKEELSIKISEAITYLFEQVCAERKRYYEGSSLRRPNEAQIIGIINTYSNYNATITGGANFVPGVLGILTLVPEIALVIRNQLCMIYDIGVAHGHEKKWTSQLLLTVFAYSIGMSMAGITVIEGGKLIVKRVSLRLFQRVLRWIGVKVTQKLLRQVLSRWVPILGAVAMAYWSRTSTKGIGTKASDFLKHDIFESECVVDHVELD